MTNVVKLVAFHPDTGDVHEMEPKTLAEYTAWVERGYARGYRSHDIGGGMVRFMSNDALEYTVFTAVITKGVIVDDEIN